MQSVLGEDNPHAKPLLEVAKNQATIPPIQDRISACKAYIERARKRVARADAVIARALEQKSIFDGEVVDGEKQLQELQLEEAQVPVLAPVPKVAELQQQIDDLVRERELMRTSQSRKHSGQWCADGPLCVKDVPPIHQDRAELEGWISDRNCDLRNALEFGNTGTITQLGTLLSQGIAQLSRVSKDVVMDGQSRSSLMESKSQTPSAGWCTLAQFPLCSLQCWGTKREGSSSLGCSVAFDAGASQAV